MDARGGLAAAMRIVENPEADASGVNSTYGSFKSSEYTSRVPILRSNKGESSGARVRELSHIPIRGRSLRSRTISMEPSLIRILRTEILASYSR